MTMPAMKFASISSPINSQPNDSQSINKKPHERNDHPSHSRVRSYHNRSDAAVRCRLGISAGNGALQLQ